MPRDRNIDDATVSGFGYEWSKFDQRQVPEEELRQYFKSYFSAFPWELVSKTAIGFDAGCGSGRWAKFVAPRVGTLHCIDASKEVLAVAQRNLDREKNCIFHHASVDEMPIPDGTMDFGYALGVLHHVPDTQAAIHACASKLKPGAPLLLYLYYALENRSALYRFLWRLSDHMRRVISRSPPSLRIATATTVAITVYWPLARAALLAEHVGVRVSPLPLSYYRHSSFYTMRTDALDRLGTRLEHRFTRDEIRSMMHAAGLEGVSFREDPPYWCAIGVRR